MERDNVIVFEGDCWLDGDAEFVALKDGGLAISVTEEKAVDSYNQEFTCRAKLTAEDVEKLRKWLALTPTGKGEG